MTDSIGFANEYPIGLNNMICICPKNVASIGHAFGIC
jgi:hypothetical protein